MNNFYWKLAKRAAEIAGEPIRPEWIYAQWAHETNNFQSDLCVQYNNLGGLTQEQPNELPQPDGEMYYMKFDTAEDYAEYFGKYLRYYDENKIFEAQNIDEYVKALKEGGYFGDDYENYVAGCKRVLRREFDTIELA